MNAAEQACHDDHLRATVDRFADATLAADYGVANFSARVAAARAAGARSSGLLAHFSSDAVVEPPLRDFFEGKLLLSVFEAVVSADPAKLATIRTALVASGWAHAEDDPARLLPAQLGGDLDLKTFCAKTGGAGQGALALYLAGIGVGGSASAAANVCTFVTSLDAVRALRTAPAPLFGPRPRSRTVCTRRGAARRPRPTTCARRS